MASPTVRRRRLAAELRALRAVSHRTIDEVSDATGISKSTLSRIENGQVGLRLPVLRALLQAYGVDGDDAARLETLSKEAAQRGWWQVTGAAVLDATPTLMGLEAEASRIDQFELAVVPGLLQTEEYAAAVIRATWPEAGAEAIEAAVGLRLKRQERLGELRLWAVVAEEALLRPVGGPDVMARQLERLTETAADAMTNVQVLAREEREHPGLGGPFMIIGFGVPFESQAVYIEGNRWDACVEERTEIEHYKHAFDNLQAMALSPQHSVARIAGIAKEFSR